jgi:hypothetical protein
MASDDALGLARCSELGLVARRREESMYDVRIVTWGRWCAGGEMGDEFGCDDEWERGDLRRVITGRKLLGSPDMPQWGRTDLPTRPANHCACASVLK